MLIEQQVQVLVPCHPPDSVAGSLIHWLSTPVTSKLLFLLPKVEYSGCILQATCHIALVSKRLVTNKPPHLDFSPIGDFADNDVTFRVDRNAVRIRQIASLVTRPPEF